MGPFGRDSPPAPGAVFDGALPKASGKRLPGGSGRFFCSLEHFARYIAKNSSSPRLLLQPFQFALAVRGNNKENAIAPNRIYSPPLPGVPAGQHRRGGAQRLQGCGDGASEAGADRRRSGEGELHAGPPP
jgi:hypothetical protein